MPSSQAERSTLRQRRPALMRQRATQRLSSQFWEGHACGGQHSLVIEVDEHGGGGKERYFIHEVSVMIQFLPKEFIVMWLKNQCGNKCMCLFACGGGGGGSGRAARWRTWPPGGCAGRCESQEGNTGGRGGGGKWMMWFKEVLEKLLLVNQLPQRECCASVPWMNTNTYNTYSY